MKQKYRLYRRNTSGRFYAQNNVTGKQESLGTSNRAEALRLLCAKNETDYQPAFNAHLARTYLSAGDPEISKRTWSIVMEALSKSKATWSRSTQDRYVSSMKEKALDPLRELPLVETRPEHLLEAIHQGTVSTNIFLRRLHGFAVAMKWLPWPILMPRQWPWIRFKPRRGVSWEEHQKLLAREIDPERHAFLELLWHVGAAQIDLVSLTADNVDWSHRTICYLRRKTGKPAIVRFGEEVAAILQRLPASGLLFPNWSKLSSADRADRFHTRCKSLGICGISLHSYRYAWAERAAAAGYPERYAQAALGHGSAAIHRAYAKKARIELPALEEYEQAAAKIVSLPAESPKQVTVAQP